MRVRDTILIVLLALIMLPSLAAAQLTLQGNVTDPEGNALVGVNVYEKSSRHGTTTNTEGFYSITYSSNDAVIVFSLVGFKRQEIAAGGKAEFNVTLQEGLALGEVTVVGSRREDRSVTETPVAIDVIDVGDVTLRNGQLDIHQILQYVAPSFNANRQSGADGADHIDPATLRGLGPDQTLVLINGKRRHQSSLINIFGSRGRGNTGTDLDAIPASAVERIEILRDGASAQYGSDAIAGVINIVLKSDADQFTGSITAGAHSSKFRPDRSYDGEESQVSSNYGIKVGEGGFLNMSLDYLSKGRTNRPADPVKYGIYRQQFGDGKLENFSTFANSAFPIGERASIYAFGGLNYRHTDAFAWTRDSASSRNIPAIYPNGFDPHILSTISDPSLSVGMKTKVHEWNLDVNNTIGANRFHYVVDGTLNASLLEKSPTRFDAGGFQLGQNTSGFNLNRFFATAMSGVNVALGVEYRIEKYEIFAGEEGSYRNYGVIDTVINGRVVKYDVLGRAGGSQGFPGFSPTDVVDESRTNLGSYVDIEADITRQWMVTGAARFEHYSDFGNTINTKLASRFKASDLFALRGSVSSGFRAPSLAQIYFNSTFTDFVSGVPVDKLIAKNNSPITRTLGIPSLKEETARNGSLGFTATPFEGFTATVDGYYVEIKDRIVLTGAFDQSDPDIGADLVALNVGAAQFFTNAIDTRTRGIDVVLSYVRDFDGNRFRFSYAGNFNEMNLGEITTSAKLKGKEDIYFGRREQYFLLASAPPRKMTLTVDYDRERFHATARATNFGTVTLIDWLDTEDNYQAATTADVSLGYDVTNSISLILGAANVFDTYPTEQDTETETGGNWDAVQMGFSGRFMFARLSFNL